MRRSRPVTFVIFIAAFVAIIGYVYLRVYPHPVGSHHELSQLVGRKVSFVGEFDGDSKMFDKALLDGKWVRFYHSLGSIDWSQKTGEVCRFTGQVEYDANNPYGITFAIRNGEYYPR